MKTCEDCIHNGGEAKQQGTSEVQEWIHCKQPIPYYLVRLPVPFKIKDKIVEHDCKCYEKKEPCPACGVQMPRVETYGCWQCGYNH